MASGTSASATQAGLLRALGAAVRALRAERGLSRKAAAARAGLSERFLAALEAGEGNISIARLCNVAGALGVEASVLLARAEQARGAALARAEARPWRARPVLALLGLRGAGKSSVGAAVAARCGVPFVELDGLVEQAAGTSLRELFELHGDEYFRRLERGALQGVLERGERCVLATGGGLVTQHATYELLRREATTVWLRARPEEHWARVVAQGDTRPMRDRSDAMADLERLLRARGPLYERAAHTVDTSALGFEAAVEAVLEVVCGGPSRAT